MKKIKICHFNGKRGGFGALKRTLRLINESSKFKLQLVVSDMHLDIRFGETQKEVLDSFHVDAEVPLGQEGSSNADRAEAVGKALSGCARVFEKLKPDALLVLGDRGEVLSAVIAAVNLNIPVLHVEGGDVTGNLDDSFRHAITKLSHLHFVSTGEAGERVRKMGEEDWRINVVGDAHLDLIVNNEYNSFESIHKKYGLGNKEKYLIVLQHPVTTAPQNSYRELKVTLGAVNRLGMKTILIYPCSDQGYEGTIKAIEEYRENTNFLIHKNIPAGDFLGLLSKAQVLVGNSSAGLKEAPLFRVPTVNLTTRQGNRLRGPSVLSLIDGTTSKQIEIAVKHVISNEKWRKSNLDGLSPYGEGKTSENILKVLGQTKFDQKLFEKKMTY